MINGTLCGILLIIGSYLVGNFCTAYVYTKVVKHEDIRNYGSGNAGTTNVLRTSGKKAALLVFVIDALKGTLCILVAKWLVATVGISEFYIAGAGIAVLCGHNWPVFLGFRGGKGSATSIGIIFSMAPLVGGISLVVGIVVILLFRMVSLMSITTAVVLPIVTAILYGFVWSPVLLMTIFMACCTVFQHRSNIKRIIAGTESKIGQKVQMKSDEEKRQQ